MKRYIQPNVTPVLLTATAIICASGAQTEEKTLDRNKAGSGVDLTRTAHRGFGNGLWEDMQ